MDDSFKVRVERLFGSRLFESVPSSSFPESSWSVTDGEVERKEWNRGGNGPLDDREDLPCASAFDECFYKNVERSRLPKSQGFLDELDDRDGGEEESEAGGEEDDDDAEKEEREIRSSIGLDATLDYEEEEDEYDRAAVGSETVPERMYMRDVKDCGTYVNYHTVIEDSGDEVSFARDPRADHSAASARLKEDTAAGVSLRLDSTTKYAAPNANVAEGDFNLKPILKRKSDLTDSRPKKQVRFGFPCEDHPVGRSIGSEDSLSTPAATDARTLAETGTPLLEDSRSVPDYVRNPSKYVRYTFDAEDDVNDESNRRALADVWRILRASKTENEQDAGPDGNTEPPKTVIFTQRKRAAEAATVDHSLGDNSGGVPTKEAVNVIVRSLGIAAAEAQGSDLCAMEEDPIAMGVTEERRVASQKSCRQYRSRTHSEDSVF